MLEIWGRRNSSNVMPVMWAIGELNIPHLRHDVGGSFGGLDTPGYLAMNPNGWIPTINDDGFVLWESNAIVRYLSRGYGAGTLWPDSEKQCAIADQWMEWLKTTLYPLYIDLFWAIVRTEPALRDRDTIAKLTAALGESLMILEARLAQHQYLAGDALTMADIPYGSLAYRYYNLEIQRPELPFMTAWYERLCERPAYRENVMFSFGRSPGEWYLLERKGHSGSGTQAG